MKYFWFSLFFPIACFSQNDSTYHRIRNAGNESMATGDYAANWQSLSKYKVPTWFRNAKFGIWAHWGPQCQPAKGDWYGRFMYEEDSYQYKSHLQHYGHPSEFGFKDVIHTWKAARWNPEQLIRLYKRAGAQYFFAMANHHDNLDMWANPYQEWNTVHVGPHKDIISIWEKAARKAHLYFGLSVHASHAWTWYETAQRSDTVGAYKNIPYDGSLTKADGKGKWWEGLDPQALYAQNHPLSKGSKQNKWMSNEQWDWKDSASIPSQEYCEKFYNRTMDLINKFHPDLLYFDDTGLPLQTVSDAGLKIAAHFYNTNKQNHQGNLNAVLFGKILTEEQKKCMVWDVERGAPDAIQELPWQTCTCIGDWHYNEDVYRDNRYKSAKTVIQMLIDVVSKNGNLLLNIPIKGDGTIDDKELNIVQNIAQWMDINKESIFNTRPWMYYGEGPQAENKNPIEAQGFNESKLTYTEKDIRFNQKGRFLYVSVLGVPNEDIKIKHLANVKNIKNVQLLGSKVKIHWNVTAENMVIEKPQIIPNDIALVYKITFNKMPQK